MTSLPDGWRWATLGELGRWATGGTPSRGNSKFYGGTVPWVKTGELQDGVVATADEFLTDAGIDASNAKLFPRGSLLVAMYGATVGKLGILGIEATTNQACAALIADASSAPMIPYLFHYLKSAREDLRAKAQGGAQPNISLGMLKNYPVPLPPIDVQRRIVTKLDALLAQSRAAREQLEAVPALVEQYRQSVLAAAFRGDLTSDWRKKNPDVEPASKLLERIRIERRQKWEVAELTKMKSKGKAPKDDKWKSKYVEPEPVDTSDLPELPPTWCWTSFDELTSDSLYGPRFAANDYAEEGVPTIRTTDMHPLGFVQFAEPPRVRVSDEQLASLGLQHHDILVTRTGSIGRCALYENALGPALPSAYLIRFRLVLPLVAAKYALRFLLSPRAQTAMGLGTTAVTQPNINARTLGRIAVPLAPLEEQHAANQVMNERLSSISRLEVAAENIDTNSLERSLLAKAFRGELVS